MGDNGGDGTKTGLRVAAIVVLAPAGVGNRGEQGRFKCR